MTAAHIRFDGSSIETKYVTVDTNILDDSSNFECPFALDSLVESTKFNSLMKIKSKPFAICQVMLKVTKETIERIVPSL